MTGSSSSSPAAAVFPTYVVKLAFSPHLKHILYVTFPRELVVFDLQYETALYAAALPRGCGKFLDVLPDPNHDWLYCAHLDGKLSIWKRKEGEQVHVMCTMEELMPSIGTIVPSPLILAVVICESDSTLQNVAKQYSDAPPSPASSVEFDNPFDFSDDSLLVSKTRLISISDDGKVWNWLLTSEGDLCAQKDKNDASAVPDATEVSALENDTETSGSTTEGIASKEIQQSVNVSDGRSRKSKSSLNEMEISFKMSLVGQLQLLSSTVTMLAVPSPSLMATLARQLHSITLWHIIVISSLAE